MIVSIIYTTCKERDLKKICEVKFGIIGLEKI
mgnify:CR=1 FL=1